MVNFELLFIGVSLVLVVIGFKKNHRKMMLAGYICLCIGLAAEPFANGFEQGYNDFIHSRASDT
ncbi:hypothetical protein [Alteromonas gilva]|uniref:Uncharacterized protein n=1 Tax=Alteromonas gilva TaxID=2987522 RepID=A0ABT5L2T1_9ALTE|nr:hypothetical protein [Alteromonas gilva]MDC8831342.1 hypothetical protein [Alteromonas gilva]